MIKIHRSAVQPPMSLAKEAIEVRLQAAEAFFAITEIQRGQKRFNFNLQFAQPELQEQVHALFFDKCAYCESYIPAKGKPTPYLDRFRPTSGAIGANGAVSPDAYWWLAYEWENMYSCCVHCNRAKGSRFPVRGKRASPGTKGDALKNEKALLVDPCNDEPDDHLFFHTDGLVSGKTYKGRTTVEVFALNRDELVKRRAEAARQFEIFELYGISVGGDVASSALDPSREFTALRRQMARDFVNQRENSEQANAAKRLQDAHGHDIRDYSLADPESNARRSRVRTRYVESVSLVNVGIHEHTEFRIASAATAGAPWMVLLGENGVGKSTVLKAIAFLLAGEEKWRELGEFSEALMPRRNSVKGTIGKITLGLSDGQELYMTIDADGQRIETNAQAPKLFLLGFGATRLPPNKHHRPPVEKRYTRVLNLFDPFTPLCDAPSWLASLSRLQFERAGRTLKALLDLAEEAYFVKRTGNVYLIHGDFEQDIRSLSDGYQTIIGIGCDIMSVLLLPGLPIEQAEGIVLIDEIGNHLHPSWRMRFVAALKNGFPRVQFIATTHEPLCLRGLENDEAAVLKRDNAHRVRLVEDLPPIRGLLVDQILSSPHFGLRSTVDPEFGTMLDEYYELIAKDEPTKDDRERMKLLEPVISDLRLVGDSPREQALLRTIDSYLASAEASLEMIDPAHLPEELERELFSLLQASGDVGGSND
ncbi:AAA family ATPase [Cupriavidus pauculus]|uniref:AAA family ATPase n=1 Tax=Cupriavidus pauculus TaxID=82633 RepID=UPI001EE34A34|nr:AAA family ATPase [Cupriavidus pauculus]GJG94333.1 AAA family ATPase [Cupriavidus pauculus]